MSRESERESRRCIDVLYVSVCSTIKLDKNNRCEAKQRARHRERETKRKWEISTFIVLLCTYFSRIIYVTATTTGRQWSISECDLYSDANRRSDIMLRTDTSSIFTSKHRWRLNAAWQIIDQCIIDFKTISTYDNWSVFTSDSVREGLSVKVFNENGHRVDQILLYEVFDLILEDRRRSGRDWIFSNQNACDYRESRSKAMVNATTKTKERFLSRCLLLFGTIEMQIDRCVLRTCHSQRLLCLIE